MSKQLTMASLFDGSGGFPLAALMNDVVPLWSSEIEPFPIRVTTKRMPFIRHLGDVSNINGGSVPPVDIITFGSPCQDMSLAGKRAGLGGDRSSLFYEAIRIVKEMRSATNGEYPKYIVWENVPGAFSSQKGQDFRAVLEQIVRIKDETITLPMPKKDKWLSAGEVVGDGYSVAWRTIDAQYFGVAQRRRRIYLVADFRNECAGQILFKFEGLSGYSPQSFSSWEGASKNAEGCIDSASSKAFSIENHSQDSRYKIREDGTSQTLASRMGTGGNNVPLVLNERDPNYSVTENQASTLVATDYKGPQCVTEPITMKIRSGCEGGGKGALMQKNKSATLSTQNDQTVFEPTACIQGKVVGRKDKNSPNGCGYTTDGTAYTLNTVDKHAVIYAIDRPAINCGKGYPCGCVTDDGINSTLVAAGPSAIAEPSSFYPQMKAESQSFRTGVANTIVNGTNPGFQNGVVETNYAVRRLTPSECAKLQGFPWWWAKGLAIAEPTDEDVDFWFDVFETHRKATTPDKKPKTKSQIIKWLKNPESDSAEYKMWGNGIALPCAAFVFAGIKYFYQR